jgi:hypothetical protein
MTLAPHITKLAFDLADAVCNPNGYADEPDDSDRRAEERDQLVVDLLQTVQPYVGGS